MRTAMLFGCFLALTAGSGAAGKKVIEKRDDLPRYTYRLDVKAVELLQDPVRLAALAAQVKRDLEADLQQFEIRDKTTLKDFYSSLSDIAILQQQWDEYFALLDKRRSLEEKEATRLTTGLVGEVVVRGRKLNVPDLQAFVRTELQKKAAGLPFATVAANLKSAKGSAEILTENLIVGNISSSIQPMLDQTAGELSREVATGLLSSAYTLAAFLPVRESVRDALAAVIDANQVEKPDIWKGRDFSLQAGQGRAPAVLAVWDSGVDARIFARTEQLWVNLDEIPGNGKDDDGNGFVDDVHGIAYSLHSDKEVPLLTSVGALDDSEAVYRRYMKGLSDIQASIESPEATELKQKIGALSQEKVKPFIESINLYSAYAHGTHVAGIAAADNPYARILAARITFDHRMIPETPTVEQAEKDAAAAREVVRYFKENGVRVVNMSWGGSVAAIESALERNGAGGSPLERKALARKIFTIYDAALRDAIQSAPEILFVTSAGNSDNDVRFDEFLPSAYEYPNMLSVGAVDQAGDETSFTSFGKVDIYANGFEVESWVPGAERLKMSGTSMSSPQVTNLAGKLLSLNPKLTVPQLRQLILEGGDEKKAGDRTVRLLNPVRSKELLAALP